MKHLVHFLVYFLVLPTGYSLSCTFTGLVDSDWDNASNWSCGSVPGIADTAIIPGLDIQLNTQTKVAHLVLSGSGRIRGHHELVVIGDFIWGGMDIGNSLGGNMIIQGKTIIQNGSEKKIIGRSVFCMGGVQWISGNMRLDSQAVLTFGADQIARLESPNFTTLSSFNDSKFINRGTLIRDSGSMSEFAINADFENYDSLIIQDGHVSISNGIMDNATVQTSGFLEIKSCTFEHTTVSGDQIYHNAGIIEIYEGCTFHNQLSLLGGIFHCRSDVTATGLFFLAAEGGSIFGQVLVDSGHVLNLTGRAVWRDCEIGGEGQVLTDTLIINGSHINTVSGSTVDIVLDGFTYWNSNTIDIRGGNRIINHGHLYINSVDQELLKNHNDAYFENYDTITQVDPNTITIVEIPMLNHGCIQGGGTFFMEDYEMDGQGLFDPGYSPGTFTLMGDIDLGSGIHIEVFGDTLSAVYDSICIQGHLDISNAFFQMTEIDSVPMGRYPILLCANGAGCYTGVFDTSYLEAEYRLDFLDDRIELVKGPGCLHTWMVDALYLSGDPHLDYFSALHNVLSNGIITTGETISFRGQDHVELLKGFEVQLGGQLQVDIEFCVE